MRTRPPIDVLIVDDDAALGRVLSAGLEARDYTVEVCTTGADALDAADLLAPRVIILDLGLPDLDGVSVLTRLRSFTRVPVIVVSARSESDDKVEALDLGADDYITKPFSIEELMARVRAASRRGGREEPDLVVEAAGLRLDLTDSRATRDGEEVHLTPTEWRIVDVLARRRGRLVRQAELLTAVWGPAYDTQTNYLRVHMASIRRKLEPEPSRPRYFITEPSMGYRFELPQKH